MLRKILAGAAIAAAALLATPVAANAYGEQPPVAETIEPGEAVTFGFTGLPANTPSTAVAPDAVTLAVLKAATLSKVTSADGTVTYTASATVPGTYTITVTAGAETRVATLTVVPTDAGSGAGAGSGSSADGGLADTGVDPVLFAWIGGGALALGAALVVVLSTVRRARNQA